MPKKEDMVRDKVLDVIVKVVEKETWYACKITDVNEKVDPITYDIEWIDEEPHDKTTRFKLKDFRTKRSGFSKNTYTLIAGICKDYLGNQRRASEINTFLIINITDLDLIGTAANRVSRLYKQLLHVKKKDDFTSNIFVDAGVKKELAPIRPIECNTTSSENVYKKRLREIEIELEAKGMCKYVTRKPNDHAKQRRQIEWELTGKMTMYVYRYVRSSECQHISQASNENPTPVRRLSLERRASEPGDKRRVK